MKTEFFIVDNIELVRVDGDKIQWFSPRGWKEYKDMKSLAENGRPVSFLRAKAFIIEVKKERKSNVLRRKRR